MRRYFLVLIPGFIVVAGCGLTAQQRAELVDQAATLAGDRAAKLVLDQAAKLGLSPTATAELAALARAEAEAAARREAEKRLPPPDPAGGNILGQIVAALIAALAGGVPALAKGGKP